MARLAILLFALPWISAAQEDFSAAFQEPHRWLSFDVTSGLPSKEVYDIVTLPNGTPWVITGAGVAFYDGYQWRTVNEIPRTRARQIVAYGGDQVVVLVEGGILIGNQSGFRQYPMHKPIVGVAVLPDQTIVATIQDLTFVRWQNDRWAPLPVSELPVLPAHFFSARWNPPSITVASFSKGYDRIARPILAKLREQPQYNKPEAKIYVAGMAENDAGDGLAAIIYPPPIAGIWCWKNGGVAQPLPRISSATIEDVDIDAAGNLYILYRSGILHAKREGRWHLIPAAPPFLRHMNSLGVHSAGRFWITTDGGLSLYRDSETLWRIVVRQRESRHDAVNQMIHRTDGSWWVATGSGLLMRDADGATRSLHQIQGKQLGPLTSVVGDRKGNVWISSGLAFEGAFRFDGRRWKHFGPEQGLSGGPVHRIFLDNKDQPWFLCTGMVQQGGSGGGAFQFDGARFVRWGKQEGLPSHAVYSMAQGPDGALWFGGVEFVSRFDGKWRHYGKKNGLKGSLFTLTVDPGGRVWFGDRKNGLGSLDGDAVRYLTEKDGLISNNVMETAADGSNNVWVATRLGLSRFHNGVFTRFGLHSGLRNARLWPIAISRDREVCVGSSAGGVHCLSPSIDQLPPTRILFDRPLVERDRTLIHWRPAAFWTTGVPEDVLTRFRLDQGQWSAWTTSNQAELNGLRPGTHRLQVQTSGPFGSFDAAGAAISFVTPAPFYLSAHFLVPIGCLLIIAFALVVKLGKNSARHKIALQAKEARFRSLIENSADGIFLCGKDWRTTYVSPSFERITGYVPSDLLGRKTHKLIHPDDLPALSENMQALAMTPGESGAFLFRVLHKYGDYVWYEATAVNLLEQPEVQAIVFNFRDVTERVLVEQQLKLARRQAETASSAKSEFSGHHEP